jgi:macrolide transport system ATP-binding/permease protein
MILYNQYISRKAKLEHSIDHRQIQAKSTRNAPKRMENSEARLHKGKIKEKRKVTYFF